MRTKPPKSLARLLVAAQRSRPQPDHTAEGSGIGRQPGQRHPGGRPQVEDLPVLRRSRSCPADNRRRSGRGSLGKELATWYEDGADLYDQAVQVFESPRALRPATRPAATMGTAKAQYQNEGRLLRSRAAVRNALRAASATDLPHSRALTGNLTFGLGDSEVTRSHALRSTQPKRLAGQSSSTRRKRDKMSY